MLIFSRYRYFVFLPCFFGAARDFSFAERDIAFLFFFYQNNFEVVRLQ